MLVAVRHHAKVPALLVHMDAVVSLQVVLSFKRLTDVSEISLFIEEPSTSHTATGFHGATLRNSYKKHYSWHCI